MMLVRHAGRYVELHWDCITVDPRREDYLFGDSGSALGKAMADCFQRRAMGSPGKPEFLGSAFTGSVKRLTPDTARALADDYSRMLSLPLQDR
jgi:hypothetical protein